MPNAAVMYVLLLHCMHHLCNIYVYTKADSTLTAILLVNASDMQPLLLTSKTSTMIRSFRVHYNGDCT